MTSPRTTHRSGVAAPDASPADPGDGVNHDTATFASHRVGRERDPGRGGMPPGCTSTASRGG